MRGFVAFFALLALAFAAVPQAAHAYGEQQFLAPAPKKAHVPKKAHAPTNNCRRTNYNVPETQYVAKTINVPYDCPETKITQQCRQVATTVQRECSKTTMRTVNYSCPEMKEEVVCEAAPTTSHYGKKRRLGKASYHRPGPTYSHGKKGHAQAAPICRKITSRVNKQCTKQVPTTTVDSCPQVIQQQVCDDVSVVVPRTCTRQETTQVPVTRSKSMFREECTSVRVGKAHH